MKKIENVNFLAGVGCFLFGWIASWVIEYFVAAVFGFPTGTCVWFVIKLNIFIIAIIVTILGCMAGSYFIGEWQKEDD